MPDPKTKLVWISIPKCRILNQRWRRCVFPGTILNDFRMCFAGCWGDVFDEMPWTCDPESIKNRSRTTPNPEANTCTFFEWISGGNRIPNVLHLAILWSPFDHPNWPRVPSWAQTGSESVPEFICSWFLRVVGANVSQVWVFWDRSAHMILGTIFVWFWVITSLMLSLLPG